MSGKWKKSPEMGMFLVAELRVMVRKWVPGESWKYPSTFQWRKKTRFGELTFWSKKNVEFSVAKISYLAGLPNAPPVMNNKFYFFQIWGWVDFFLWGLGRTKARKELAGLKKINTRIKNLRCGCFSLPRWIIATAELNGWHTPDNHR